MDQATKNVLFTITAGAASSFIDPYFRETETIFNAPTTAKAKRIGLYALAASVSIGLNKRETKENILGLVIGSIFAYYAAQYTHDYEDPKEMVHIRQNADNMSWQELINAHKISTVLAKAILPKDMIQKKFEKDHADFSFSQITKRFSLSQIQECDLASSEFLKKAVISELRTRKMEFLLELDLRSLNGVLGDSLTASLKELQTNWATHQKEHATALTNLDHSYPLRTEKREALLLVKKKEIEQESNELQKILESNIFSKQVKSLRLVGQSNKEEKDRLIKEWFDEKNNVEKLSKAEDQQYNYNYKLVDLIHKKEQKEIQFLSKLEKVLANTDLNK